MSSTTDLETILKRAPQPEPPANLLAALEQQIKLNPAARTEPRASTWRKWRKVWLPLAGLAGAAALFFIIGTGWWLSTARTPASSMKVLAQMRSGHVVERFRDGKSRAIIMDKSKPAGTHPNYYTNEHPDNPLVVVEHWFEIDPHDPPLPLLRSASSSEDVWQQGNRVLTVNRKTGSRSLKLVNSPNNILATLGPLAGLAAFPLRETTSHQVPDSTLDHATGLWAGEIRVPDSSMPGGDLIVRVWLNVNNQLPARIQFLSTGFPQVAPEVLMHEYDFSEFNADFPEKTFNFDITDQDLAPMGITRAALDAMGKGAVSFDVTGESGAKVAGTVQDDAGTQRIRGTVPFTFVHDQHGALKLDLWMVDGKRRKFGVRFDNTDMRTVTSHLKGKSSANNTSTAVWNTD